MKYLLTCDNVVLRPMTIEDSMLIVKWRNEERVRKFYLYRETFTLEGQEAYFHRMVETGKVVQLMICDPATDEAIGCTVASEINEEKRTAEIGVFMGDHAAPGKHLASHGMRALAFYVFQTRPVDTVYSRIFKDNIASRKMTERTGLPYVRDLPGVLDSKGQPHDMVLHEAHRDTFLAAVRDVQWNP